uniref:Probable ATP-dependent RNA helicase DDX46 (inferred by orthology to a zebrafish protein) n=1 Tax=Strongyloides venezuelensis TaxID=75913 RepID=A0A0K0FRH2_STRVS
MARKYSVKSKSCRWSLQIFFNILDLARINAWVLYKQVTGEEISRQEFLFQLAVELAAEYQNSREKEDKPKTLINISSGSRIRKTCEVRYFTMSQRSMGTGMVRGHTNEITFNVRQPPTEAMNNTKSAMSNETSSQFTSNALQNNMRSSGRMTYEPLLYSFKIELRNKFGRDYIAIVRPCDVILEEGRKNAENYNRLDEIDNEIIVTGSVDVSKCYKTWGNAHFYPTLQVAIMKSG